jgi:flagellar protein FlbD
MIELHHGREKRPLIVNSDLIETVEATPDTVITLTTGKKLIVLETPAELVALVVEFRRRLQSGPRVVERD